MNAYEALKNAIEVKVGGDGCDGVLEPKDGDMEKWFYPLVEGKDLKVVEDTYASKEEMEAMKNEFEDACDAPMVLFWFLDVNGAQTEMVSLDYRNFWIKWINEVNGVSYGFLQI